MSQFRIKTFNRISDKGLGLFKPDRYEVGEAVENPDAYILRSQKLHGEPLASGAARDCARRRRRQ